MKPQPIRDAEWSIQFLEGLQAQPKQGRIRAWLLQAAQVALGVALTVAGFYGLLFLMMLGA